MLGSLPRSQSRSASLGEQGCRRYEQHEVNAEKERHRDAHRDVPRSRLPKGRVSKTVDMENDCLEQNHHERQEDHRFDVLPVIV